jgi:PIN domain nuclease of toxin-antitoxin system
LCDAAGDLLAVNGGDADLQKLFSKHAGVDFDTDQKEFMLAVKDMTETLTGLDLGDEDIESETDLFERMRRTMHEQMTAEAERSAKRARPARNAAQQRREAEAQQAMHSMREIFRKLASALHPDRETDDSRRQAKTELMQQVNQAYAANDLLKLLELQLQIEQIDIAHIASASTQKLKHYNKVLAEQLAELNAEIEHIELGFCIEFDLDPATRLNPRKLGPLLEQNTRELRGVLAQQQGSIRMLAGDDLGQAPAPTAARNRG